MDAVRRVKWSGLEPGWNKSIEMLVPVLTAKDSECLAQASVSAAAALTVVSPREC